jgi:hypothetical protein
MMSNAGGSWDNAKKYVESGQLGGKGSDNHKATVVGDTVGDPFKDTSGPSLNILIKLMSMVAVVVAGLTVSYSPVIQRNLGFAPTELKYRNEFLRGVEKGKLSYPSLERVQEASAVDSLFEDDPLMGTEDIITAPNDAANKSLVEPKKAVYTPGSVKPQVPAASKDAPAVADFSEGFDSNAAPSKTETKTEAQSGFDSGFDSGDFTNSDDATNADEQSDSETKEESNSNDGFSGFDAF